MMLDRLFYDAQKLYANGGLHYHNWQHVLSTLLTYGRFFGQPSAEAKLALAYHDCVYVPGAPPGVNEDLSMLTFKNTLRNAGGNPNLNVQLIELCIEGTKTDNHVSNSFMPALVRNYGLEQQVYWETVGKVLDCDLAMLGAPWEVFKQHQLDIIYEHAGPVVGAELEPWKRRSAEFLLKFLDKQDIYFTKAAQSALEAKARANINEWHRRAN